MIDTNLRTLRKTAKLTLEEVAGRVGVSRQAVAKWENGDSIPDIVNCNALAALYDVSLDALINGQSAEGVPLPPKGKHVFGTVTVGERGQIVIPKQAREIFGLRQGSRLIVFGDMQQGGLALIDTNRFVHHLDVLMAQANSEGFAQSDAPGEP